MTRARQSWTYDLEQLHRDQDSRLAVDAIAHLICWLDAEGRQTVHHFELLEHTSKGTVDHKMTLSWDVARLAKHDPRLLADLDRFRRGKMLMLEDRVKYAAYGLALVAISCILRRRVVAVSYFRPPDLLLDETPMALRGVEVAGRSSKGHAAFAQALDGAAGKPGKRVQLRERNDVIEAYISLWCRDPMVSVWEKVKP